MMEKRGYRFAHDEKPLTHSLSFSLHTTLSRYTRCCCTLCVACFARAVPFSLLLPHILFIFFFFFLQRTAFFQPNVLGNGFGRSVYLLHFYPQHEALAHQLDVKSPLTHISLTESKLELAATAYFALPVRMIPSYFCWNHFMASSFVRRWMKPILPVLRRRCATLYPGRPSTT